MKLRLRRTVAGLRRNRAGTVRYCIKLGTDETHERPGTAERKQNQTRVLKSKRFWEGTNVLKQVSISRKMLAKLAGKAHDHPTTC